MAIAMYAGSARYELTMPIGSGACATVYLARDRCTGASCSVKRIRKEMSTALFDKVRREITLMKSLDNPFIVKFFDSWEDENHFYIAMELCESGTLFNVLTRRGAFDEPTAILYLTELAFALKYLQSHNIIHRDIKVENILVDGNGHARLCDFGFSTITEDDAPHKRTACGSVAYAAPEMICREAYTNKTDIWSLGVVFYVLLTGHLPFEGATVHECMDAIVRKELVIPENLGLETRDLLIHMLDKNQETRFDVLEVLGHPCVCCHRLFDGIKRVADKRGHELVSDESATRRLMVQVLGTLENNFTPAGVRPWRSTYKSLNCNVTKSLLTVVKAAERRRKIFQSKSLTKGLVPGHVRMLLRPTNGMVLQRPKVYTNQPQVIGGLEQKPLASEIPA